MSNYKWIIVYKNGEVLTREDVSFDNLRFDIEDDIDNPVIAVIRQELS